MNKLFLTKGISVVLFIIAIFFYSGQVAVAAPQSFMPVKLTQPNGDVIECFVSGDEIFNYYHDGEGKLIIKNPDTGYYTYAKFEKDDFKPTDNIVTSQEVKKINSKYVPGNNPESILPVKQINIAKEKHLHDKLRNEITELVMTKCSDKDLEELKQVVESFLEEKDTDIHVKMKKVYKLKLNK
ncbi:hypothetical protein [Clostridium sp. ZS2-4]|uniref:hypothetical protein n=1 Tax=Clostridium sp. ZS2-4 TaxID=2987703 RepID=UPI00227D05A0|nr:hypothetical protein [Clostridium sp. ZS2-4]MCY6354165.1 hypothetical protein [Clostridium sp. ZS2-4]